MNRIAKVARDGLLLICATVAVLGIASQAAAQNTGRARTIEDVLAREYALPSAVPASGYEGIWSPIRKPGIPSLRGPDGQAIDARQARSLPRVSLYIARGVGQLGIDCSYVFQFEDLFEGSKPLVPTQEQGCGIDRAVSFSVGEDGALIAQIKGAERYPEPITLHAVNRRIAPADRLTLPEDFDIEGVRPGMRWADADMQLVQEAGYADFYTPIDGKGVVIDTTVTGTLLVKPQSALVGRGTLSYHRIEDGVAYRERSERKPNDRVSMMISPMDAAFEDDRGVVVTVQRDVNPPAGTLGAADLRASLVAKYGEPTLDQQAGQLLHWYFSRNGAPMPTMTKGFGAMTAEEKAVFRSDYCGEPTSLDPVRSSLPNLRGLEAFPEQRCGSVVMASMRLSPDGLVQDYTVALFSMDHENARDWALNGQKWRQAPDRVFGAATQ
ncbi:MAG: hypothetical protein AAGI89_05315 [Pseudomonadota bacterium]